MFEESPFEHELISSRIFMGERALKERWIKKIEEVTKQTQLQLTDWNSLTPVFGGRHGNHSEHLQPLLDEMSEVFKIDPTASW
jgi:ring-1,2-phenylacetyl-CoA epoxidase subunit PaaC